MAVDPGAEAREVFSAPIQSVITTLGQSIGEAQRSLDRSSIETQDLIDADPQLASLGVQATWYQLPRVDLELRLSMAMSEQPGPTPVEALPTLIARPPLTLIAQPVSAAYQNHFNYDVTASSVITLSIVPVPPPRAGDQVTVPPRLNPDEVQQAALASAAHFATTTDAQGRTVPDPKLRFDINFNAAVRLWYVLQYDPADPTKTPTVVSVDDATKSVRVISG
jgi:hypothetical protein